MPHVDFDEQSQSAPEPSDVTFTLDGRVWTCRDRLDIPNRVTARHAQTQSALAGNPGDMKVVADAAVASVEFIKAVLMPGEGEQLVEVLDTKGDLTSRVYGNALRLMWEHATGRPTTPAVRSSSGRKRTARKSTAGSSSRGKTRAASAG